MILYLDTSAIVKKYVREPGSTATIYAIDKARCVGSVLIARAEMAGALSKAVRLGLLTGSAAEACWHAFRKELANYYWIQANTAVVSKAEGLAWSYQLRGYDAVHLAAACVWQDDLDQPVSMGTFDLNLWHAAGHIGLLPYPENLPALIQEWKAEAGL